MFLLDNLLMAPGSAAFVIFKELARKAQDEWLDDDSVKQELQELYSLLESGRISDRDFEARECRLLERLEQIARAKYRDKWGPDETSAVPPPPVPAAAFEASPVVEQGTSVRPLMTMLASTITHGLPSVEDVAPAPPRFVLPPPSMEMPLTTSERPVAATVPDVPLCVPPAAAPLQSAVALADRPAAPAPVAPAAGGALSMPQVMDCATRALAMLKLKVSAITSVASDEGGWKVTAELVERKGVPDTNDLLGLYELRLDGAGNMLRYERTRMRRRGDLNRS